MQKHLIRFFTTILVITLFLALITGVLVTLKLFGITAIAELPWATVTAALWWPAVGVGAIALLLIVGLFLYLLYATGKALFFS
ncbi:hypothetical protein BWI97_08690 [Siphonobacter sp. BAB-5405]|uniref:hypothetical protein n=1 Tax=Siphonobacter sp. BAB-5405 TaxID=1864825 RepID=UPI000C809864|nr:hypothetical protein [Siphonobacter sp. BAB-5405]PMD97676.1 hypothetical protein BWI97_08690 [Siphonobacter sp. BAB-5405]